MNRRLLLVIALIVLVILALIFLGFCRQQATDESPQTSATTAPKAAATGAAPASATASTSKIDSFVVKQGNATTPTATTAPKSVAGTNEFTSLLERYRNAEFRATYAMSVPGLSAGSTMTIAHTKDRSRIDFAAQGATVTVLQLPDKSYFCIAEQRSCFDASAAGLGGAGGPVSNPLVGAVQDFNKNAAGYTTRQIDTRRIAGLEARCFAFSGQGGVSGVTCLGPEGQMLSTETTSAAGASKLTATKIEAKPAASDFEPPYPVAAIPGPGGFGGIATPPPRP